MIANVAIGVLLLVCWGGYAKMTEPPVVQAPTVSGAVKIVGQLEKSDEEKLKILNLNRRKQ